MIIVKLTDKEINKSVECAKMFRQSVVEKNRKQPGYVATENEDYNSALNGVMSEVAASKWFEIDYTYDWSYDPTRHDLTNGVEVRSTQHIKGHLILELADKFAPHILAIVHPVSKVVVLQGWINLIDGLQPKYYREPPIVRTASYWIPQSDLCDMKLLKAKLAA